MLFTIEKVYTIYGLFPKSVPLDTKYRSYIEINQPYKSTAYNSEKEICVDR
jgi:hypothetical protein